MNITYDVTWKRQGEDDLFTCRNLTPREALARIIKAIDVSGPITVVAIELREAESKPVNPP